MNTEWRLAWFHGSVLSKIWTNNIQNPWYGRSLLRLSWTLFWVVVVARIYTQTHVWACTTMTTIHQLHSTEKQDLCVQSIKPTAHQWQAHLTAKRYNRSHCLDSYWSDGERGSNKAQMIGHCNIWLPGVVWTGTQSIGAMGHTNLSTIGLTEARCAPWDISLQCQRASLRLATVDQTLHPHMSHCG